MIARFFSIFNLLLSLLPSPCITGKRWETGTETLVKLGFKKKQNKIHPVTFHLCGAKEQEFGIPFSYRFDLRSGLQLQVNMTDKSSFILHDDETR